MSWLSFFNLFYYILLYFAQFYLNLTIQKGYKMLKCYNVYFLFLYSKVDNFKNTLPKHFFDLNKTQIFYNFFKSRKLYIYLANPFRWPWRRLRKKSFYFSLVLREFGSEELKQWTFIYTYVTYVITSRCNTSSSTF